MTTNIENEVESLLEVGQLPRANDLRVAGVQSILDSSLYGKLYERVFLSVDAAYRNGRRTTNVEVTVEERRSAQFRELKRVLEARGYVMIVYKPDDKSNHRCFIDWRG